MNQALALEIMLSGQSVLLTGAAGSGKTYVLNEFIRHSKEAGKAVAVTATTGLAASHLGGVTIHAWSGMGVHSELPSNFFSNLTKARQETILKADILVVDEISMLHDYRLDIVDKITRKVRGKDVPFGGLQIVLCGDFFQLPPVNRNGEKAGSFVVDSSAWQELDPTVCYLEEQHRQDDPAFLEILNALRAGDIRRHHAEQLLARLDVELPGHQELAELHTTNVNVDAINADRLNNLKTDAYSYRMQTTGKEQYVETLKRSCLAPEELLLKEGALVMCVKNSADKKYVNGSLGVVAGFDDDTHYPIVSLANGRELTISPETWELRDGDKKKAGLTQVPLRLAWAITIHKSQGMTLDAARINLKRAFVEGMGYVALSRVRRLDALSLSGINNMALKVSPVALAIDKQLRTRAAKDQEKFAYLEELAEKRTKQQETKPKTSVGSDWAVKLAKMRQQYPRAFRPWAKADDEKLLELYKADSDLKAICAAMQRQPGGVKARLKKHLGEDMIKF
jgi:ATP-dependent exoDNAse (exonuclease V) alpha subunit